MKQQTNKFRALTLLSLLIGNWAVLEVKDLGRGVSDEELKLMTEPFYRGEASQNKSGVGLGLYIAQYCVEACGGSRMGWSCASNCGLREMQIP